MEIPHQKKLTTKISKKVLLSLAALFLFANGSCSYLIPKKQTISPANNDIALSKRPFLVSIPDTQIVPKIKILAKNKNFWKISLQLRDQKGTLLGRYMWYQVQKKRKKIDIIWPILVGSQMYVARMLATQLFVPRGIDAIIIRPEKKPFSKTRPKTPQQLHHFHVRTIQRFLYLRKWLQSKSEYKDAMYGMTGTSYGGIVASMCLPYTQNFVSVKLIMAGGGIDDILMHSKEKKVRQWRDSILQIYRNQNKTSDILTRELSAMRLEPLNYGFYGRSLTKKNRLTMIISKYDEHVPYKNQIQLWQQYNKPKSLIIRTGHYTSLLAFFPMMRFMGQMVDIHYH